jgi:hypothetical protein
MEDVKPVYGILRPVKTWNPILINFKHSYQLCKDAWRTERFYDKLRIWFMPTGWRPEDVATKYPLEHIKDPKELVKYETHNPFILIFWSWFQFGVALLMMLHMFSVIHNYPGGLGYLYVALIFAHIFSFTSLLDGEKYGIFVEILKVAAAGYVLYSQDFSWYGISGQLVNVVFIYFILSLVITLKKLNK